ncbi:putative F-box protein At1g58090 [Capsella rubella]|uniref:putative F-box protein At1g58090 n=1 Tax=Capsella rubella TaxID=81985 RepID=UPI000CD4E23E|nr:putative F-box protein At1g58090 [Capsella rubella]
MFLFIYDFHEGGGEGLVLNPFLRKPKWIVVDVISYGKGMGYSGNRHDEKSYKIIGNVNVFHFATNEWKVTEHITCTYPETGQCFIQMLDFSKEIRKVFCVLPCKGGKSTRILSVYKGDRFSVLEQSIETRAIEIWVTKNKIGNGEDDGENVVWIKFMTMPIPNFPMLLCNNSTSYFVDNNIYGKSFVLCFHSEEPREAWVYIVRGDVCKRIKIEEVVCMFDSSVYVPTLITIS